MSRSLTYHICKVHLFIYLCNIRQHLQVLGLRMGIYFFGRGGCRLLFSLSQCTLWPSKFISIPHVECIHPHLIIALILNLSQHQFGSKTSFKYHRLKSQILSSKSYKSGISGTPGMIHHEENFLSICGTVKFENMLIAAKIQWQDRQGIMVIDISIPKRRKWKEERSHWSYTISKSSEKNSIRFQGLEIILCGLWLYPLSSGLYPGNHSLFYFTFWRSLCCSWIVLWACFLPVEFWESYSFPSFCPISVPFIPNWQCFC